MATVYDPLKAEGPGCGLDHPESYWAATAGAAPPDDGPLRGDREAEVAIIGGGYTGLSCAFHLARNYGLRPVVLEANRPAWGCSGRNGGFARPAIGRIGHRQWIERWGEKAAQALFSECFEALATVKSLIRDGGIDCDFRAGGWLKVAHRANRVRDLEADQRFLEKTFGYRAELLSAEDLVRDHYRGGESFGALRWPDAAGLHPLKLGYGMLRMAREAGAVVHAASPVQGWSKDAGHHILCTPGGRLRIRTVVLASNGYTPERLHTEATARLLPVLSNIVVTRRLSDDERAAANLFTTHVMSDTRALLNYYRVLSDGRIMLGCRGPVGGNAAVNLRHREVLLATIAAKFPSLQNLRADYFWGGWIAVSYDHVPHIHYAVDDPSVHYAIGYCGTGVSAALHAGRRLAERLGGAGESEANRIASVLNKPLPRYPLAAFRRLGQRAVFFWHSARDAYL